MLHVNKFIINTSQCYTEANSYHKPNTYSNSTTKLKPPLQILSRDFSSFDIILLYLKFQTCFNIK